MKETEQETSNLSYPQKRDIFFFNQLYIKIKKYKFPLGTSLLRFLLVSVSFGHPMLKQKD